MNRFLHSNNIHGPANIMNIYRMSRKKMRRSFCLIPQNLNILEDWDMIHLKGDIHRYVLSTSSFLCDIREPRYRQNNIGYQIIKIVKYSLAM